MGNFMIPVCCICGTAAASWHNAEWEAAGGLQDFCPEHANLGTFDQYLMTSTAKSTGQIIASNLHACQIISGRDVERVALQIDKNQKRLIEALEGVENNLTAFRDGKAGPLLVTETLKSVRLTLHAELTGQFQP